MQRTALRAAADADGVRRVSVVGLAISRKATLQAFQNSPASSGASRPSAPIVPDRTAEYLRSSFYEQLVEHVFISELLQEAWFRFHRVVEVLRAEVDASGYDIVLECEGILRHIQLKTSRTAARAGSQKIALALGTKPSGCVVWILRSEDRDTCRMSLSYLFFGGQPGQPLPDISQLKVARHTKGDSKGRKKERSGLRVVPKSKFRAMPSTTVLLEHLFGLRLETSA